MSIIHDLMKYRKYECGVCGTKQTYYDKVNRKYKWYKTLVKDEAGFWCSRCYHSVKIQIDTYEPVRA